MTTNSNISRPIFSSHGWNIPATTHTHAHTITHLCTHIAALCTCVITVSPANWMNGLSKKTCPCNLYRNNNQNNPNNFWNLKSNSCDTFTSDLKHKCYPDSIISLTQSCMATKRLLNMIWVVLLVLMSFRKAGDNLYGSLFYQLLILNDFVHRGVNAFIHRVMMSDCKWISANNDCYKCELIGSMFWFCVLFFHTFFYEQSHAAHFISKNNTRVYMMTMVTHSTCCAEFFFFFLQP